VQHEVVHRWVGAVATAELAAAPVLQRITPLRFVLRCARGTRDTSAGVEIVPATADRGHLERRMPLASRVDPFGNLFADAARGDFLGNRGGRLHEHNRTLGRRRWASRSWICCRLAFKGRRRDVWGPGYTELFFLDEPTALAAGHRPCFECRRAEAQAFASALASATGSRARAHEIDRRLHAERLDGRAKRLHRLPIADLPDGAFLLDRGAAVAARGRWLLVWSPAAYIARRPRPRAGMVEVLTPPSILAVLAHGYRPQWHASAALIS